MTFLNKIDNTSSTTIILLAFQTSSVAAGFGRHGMSPPVCNPDLGLFDLETGGRVASKVGTFIPNLGMLGLWVLELFAMYVTGGQTDRWTDKSNAYCPFPIVGAGPSFANTGPLAPAGPASHFPLSLPLPSSTVSPSVYHLLSLTFSSPPSPSK